MHKTSCNLSIKSTLLSKWEHKKTNYDTFCNASWGIYYKIFTKIIADKLFFYVIYFAIWGGNNGV